MKGSASLSHLGKQLKMQSELELIMCLMREIC